MARLRRQVVLLTRQPEGYTATRVNSSAGSRPDLDFFLLDPHELYLHLSDGQPAIQINGLKLTPAQTVLIPRLSSLATEFSIAALKHLEAAGYNSLNPYEGLLRLRHKFNSLTELATAGLPVPDSAMLRAPSDIAPAVSRLGGYPVVLKFIRGNQGVGVVLAPDENTARSVLEALNLVQYDVLLQRYYPEAAQGDLRVLVLDGEARWAIRRVNSEGEFRANYHRGALPEPVELSSELAELSVSAASVFGLRLAGVDIVETAAGPLVLEVNGSPGFQAIEAAHSADVAGAILDSTCG